IVRTFAFPAVPDSAIRFSGADTFIYRLTLTTGAFVDHVFPLAVNGAAAATVEAVGWNIPAAAASVTVPPGSGSALLTLAHPLWANTAGVRREPLAAVAEREPSSR